MAAGLPKTAVSPVRGAGDLKQPVPVAQARSLTQNATRLTFDKSPNKIQNAPARDYSETEVILDEDFSLMTEGTEENPVTLIGTSYDYIDDSLTHAPGWFGACVFQAGGSAGMCEPEIGGLINTPIGDYYGHLKISLKLRYRGHLNQGSTHGSCVFVSVCSGDFDYPSGVYYAQVDQEGDNDWEEYTFECINPNKGDCFIQINAVTYSTDGWLVDDIRVERDYDFVTPPTSAEMTGYHQDGFSVRWAGAEQAASYQMNLWEEVKLQEEGVHEVVDFENYAYMMMSDWEFNTVLGYGMAADGQGQDGTTGLYLFNNGNVKMPENGGFLTSYKVFVRPVGELNEDDRLSLKLTNGDNVIDVADVIVTNIDKEEGYLVDFVADGVNLNNAKAVQIEFLTSNPNGAIAIDNIEYETTPPTKTTLIQEELPIQGTEHTFTGLNPENEYYIALRSVRDDGALSDWTGSAHILGLPCPIVSEATEIDRRGAYTANWQAAPKAVGYVAVNYEANLVTEDNDAFPVFTETFANCDGTDENPYYLESDNYDGHSDNDGWFCPYLEYYGGKASSAQVADGKIVCQSYSYLETPSLCLSGNDGKFTLDFTFWGLTGVGEKLMVQYGDEVRECPVPEDATGADLAAVPVHLEFENGVDDHTIMFRTATSQRFMIDDVKITQSLKKGDFIYFKKSTEQVDGETLSHRFTGLDSSKNYAFAVVSLGEYFGTGFNSYYSDKQFVQFVEADVDEIQQISNVSVTAGKGAVCITLSEAQPAEVFSADGCKVASVLCQNGTTVIPVESGRIYLVRLSGKTFKVIVK